MATYAVGDIQACLDGLESLLSRIGFRRGHDRLLFCGDLIGRGPAAAETLRFIRGLKRSAISLLGNHDLHLLALLAQNRAPKSQDRLDELLRAPDAETLLDWLRHQRLAYFDRRHRYLLVHAGLAPQWTRSKTLALAREVENCLRDRRRGDALLRALHGDEPRAWHDDLAGIDRLRCIVNILTRARACTADGVFDYHYKLRVDGMPPTLRPWFAVPGRRSANTTIVFGHWSTLDRIHWPDSRVYGLDTGYIWGGRLSALRLDDARLFQVAVASAAMASASLES